MLTIRPATLADVPAITAIYNEAVRDTTASYDLEPVSVASREAWFEQHARDGHAVLVAVDAEAGVVGWGSLSTFRAKPGYRFTVENSVYVTAAMRGRGVGGRLLDALIEAARAGGYHVVVAGVDSANAASVKLHAARGFVEVGHMREIGRKFDRWLDVTFLQLMLTPSDQVPIER